MSPEERLAAAFDRIDAANAQDPNLDHDGHQEVPKELLYGQRMSATLRAFAPDASDPVQLAARAQHIRRWTVPRSDFPMDRAGYHRWRTHLYGVHADEAEAILRDVGYDDETVRQVRKMLQKKGIKSDPEVQLLEDVICLCFLRHYWAAFAAQHDEAKLIGILQKTWRKMSTEGQAAALKLPLRPDDVALIEKALAG
ncbi:MAG: DUF4202 domain-containing protein [Myxococcota bacterium]